MTQPTERQHTAATERLKIIAAAGRDLKNVPGPPGKATLKLASDAGCSRRQVQITLKAWGQRAYRSLYPLNVVETDKLVDGKYCGVTKYTWEGKHE